ncbi:MAG TPA: DNA N-6-adenine-methyltransferase [Chloroflexota bacterium]|jgi:site-specific DNA-methyltransferase (adenine-specific)|nr:DNA N-6-adenine-methyltransferase [Chloroflexota bacterium]
MDPFPELDRLRDDFVRRLREAGEKGTAGVIERGLLLIEAKAALFLARGRGYWLTTLEDAGFRRDEAEDLMAIAADPTLSNAGNYPHLPHAVSALRALADLGRACEPGKLDALLAEGKIHPRLIAREVAGLVPAADIGYDPNGWRTPRDLFDRLAKRYGPFTVDLAASPENALCDRFYTEEDDALAQDWYLETGFCNPPYDDIEPWLAKALRASVDDEAVTVFVLPARTDQPWWREYVVPFAAEVEFLGRQCFDPPIGYTGRRGSSPEKTAVVVFGHVIVPPLITGANGETITIEEALDDEDVIADVIARWRAQANELLMFARSARALQAVAHSHH